MEKRDSTRLSAEVDTLVAELGDAELYDTVRRLKAALGPVEPSPVFREELRHRLERTARREPSRILISSSDERRRSVLVGAALVSVAGALVYLWRSRSPQQSGRELPPAIPSVIG